MFCDLFPVTFNGGRTNRRTDVLTDERTYCVQTNEQTNGRTDVQTDEQTDVQTDERTNGSTDIRNIQSHNAVRLYWKRVITGTSLTRPRQHVNFNV